MLPPTLVVPRLSCKPDAPHSALGLLVSGFCFLVYGPLVFSCPQVAAQEKTFDPLQIQRMLISPDRVPAELKRVKLGTLVQMPRSEFEELVQQALRQIDALGNPPRLIEARYQAALAGSALVGSGHLRMVNPAAVPGVMPLQPWNLAVVKGRRSKGRADFSSALIADWKNQGPGLFIDEPGESSVDIDWTLRGDQSPAGLHFEIQLPACPLATFDLSLPSDQAVVSESDSFLVSGPSPPDSRGRSSWRIEFGGQSKLDLMIRPRRSETAKPVILSQVIATHSFRPDSVQVDFEVKLEVCGQAINRPLIFEFDPALQPTEVSASNLESWQVPNPSELQIRLRRPFQGGSIQIRCLALRKGVWELPRLDLKGAVRRGETIVLRIPTDLQIKSWHPGRFRLTGNEIRAGAGQVLTLTAVNLSPETTHPLPRVELEPASCRYQIRQLAWWQITGSGSSLYEQLAFDVTKGDLHELQLLAPPGWEIEKAEVVPAELARTKTITQKDGGSILSIDLQRPLSAGSTLDRGVSPRLSVTLHPLQPFREGAVSFPDLIPQGAGFREGALAINVDPAFQAQVVGLKAEIPLEERGPWGKQPPDFYFSYRGQPLSGYLELKPRHFQFKALASSEATIVSDRASQVTRLIFEPQEGKPRNLLVWFTAALPKKFSWRTTTGRGGVEASRRLISGEFQSLLACLAGPYSIPGLALLPWTPHGELWQLQLDRPLQGPLTVEATFDLPGRYRRAKSETQNPKSEKPGLGIADFRFQNSDFCDWDLPLPMVLQAGNFDGKLIVHSDPAEQIQITTLGCRLDQPAKVDSQKIYEYGPGPGMITVRGPVGKSDQETKPAFSDQVQLDTALDTEGRQICRLVFGISAWPQKRLPIRLPPKAHPIGAVIAEKWIGHLDWEEREGSSQVLLPVPSGHDHYAVELLYEIDEPSWIFWSEVSLLVPELPFAEPPSFIRTCRLPPGVAPLNPRTWALSGPSSTSSPLLFDDSLRGWTFWKIREKPDLPIKVRLVRPKAFLAIGCACALLLFLAGLRFRLARSPWFVVASGAFIVLLLLLPTGLQGLAIGPTLAVLTLAIIALFELIKTRTWGKTQTRIAAQLLLAIFIFLETTPTTAQVSPFRLIPKATAPNIPVYLIPGPADAPGQQTVLVAPEALEKLRSQAASFAVAPVLLDARYDGRVEESKAEFLAEWTVFSPRDQPAKVVIPLGEVQLQEAWLDKAPARPMALQHGYWMTIDGRGFHTIRFQFVTSVNSTGSGRDLEFRIPELPQSRLTLTTPAGARFLYALAARGRQALTPLTASSPPPSPARMQNEPGMRLDADLGQVSSVHVRWQQAAERTAKSTKGKPAGLDIREAYLWDFRPAGSTLFALIQYVIHEDAPTSLDITLPNPLEVRHDPRLSPTSGPRPVTGGTITPRLKEWHVAGAGNDRRLHLEFQRPLSGQVQIMLELVPRTSLGPLVDLPLPSPVGDKIAHQSMPDEPSFLAFRTEDLHAQIASHLRITGIDANDFRDYWVAAGLPDPGPTTHAFSFRRNPANPPVLRLQLQASANGASDPGATALQDVHWLVKPGQADFSAKLRLTASSRELALVEFDLPSALNLIDVTGPEVYAWSRIPAQSPERERREAPATGANHSRLQIWLKGMFAETTLELSGWMKLDEGAASRGASAPGVAAPNVPSTKDNRYLFNLPAIQLLSASNQRIHIQLESPAGSVLNAVSRKNIWPSPNIPPSRTLSSSIGAGNTIEEFLTDRSDYEGTFQLLPAPRSADSPKTQTKN